MFLHKTFKALNGLLCADVPLRNYSLTHSVLTPSLPPVVSIVSLSIKCPRKRDLLHSHPIVTAVVTG